MNTTLDFISGDAHHQIRITETDNDYQIQVGGALTWTMPGPRSDTVLRHTLEVMEINWRHGTLPDPSVADELFSAMQRLAEYQVEEEIGKLVKNCFPLDAVPVFRKFAIEEFAVQIGLVINEYWKMKQVERREPDHVEDVAIEGIPCQIKITGSQGAEYEIEIVPVVPWTATRETPSLMMKAAGLDKCSSWTAKGPFDQEGRRHLFGILDDNWQRGSLPTADNEKGLRKVIRKLTNYYVDPIIYEIKHQMFPADALTAFRRLVEEDYSAAIGQAIGDFWNERETG